MRTRWVGGVQTLSRCATLKPETKTGSRGRLLVHVFGSCPGSLSVMRTHLIGFGFTALALTVSGVAAEEPRAGKNCV
jgi:hypothetical protein